MHSLLMLETINLYSTVYFSILLITKNQIIKPVIVKTIMHGRTCLEIIDVPGNITFVRIAGIEFPITSPIREPQVSVASLAFSLSSGAKIR